MEPVLSRLTSLEVPWELASEAVFAVSYPPTKSAVRVQMDARSMGDFIESLVAERGLSAEDAVSHVCAELLELVETCPDDGAVLLGPASGGASWWHRIGAHAPLELSEGPLNWVGRPRP